MKTIEEFKKHRKEYMRAYFKKHPEKRTSKSKKYKTKYRKYAREYSRKYNERGLAVIATQAWMKRNPEKKLAHIKLQDAIRRKIIKKEPCEVCKETKADAHHEDYSKPLEVMWLCRKHHKERHALLKIRIT